MQEKKPKRLNWIILLAVILVIPLLLIKKPSVEKPEENSKTFHGVIKTGEQIERGYCAEGLYLTAEKGSYLVDQTTSLLLKIPNEGKGTKMFADQTYIGKTVEARGKYPAQEYFCEALMCDCEDYILVYSLKPRIQ